MKYCAEFEMPDEVYDEFKSFCIQEKMTMMDFLTMLVGIGYSIFLSDRDGFYEAYRSATD